MLCFGWAYCLSFQVFWLAWMVRLNPRMHQQVGGRKQERDSIMPFWLLAFSDNKQPPLTNLVLGSAFCMAHITHNVPAVHRLGLKVAK